MRTMVDVWFLDGPLRGKHLKVPEDDVRRDLLQVLHPAAKDADPNVVYKAHSTRYSIRWTATRGWVARAIVDGM